MSPFREPATPSTPKSFAEVPDEMLCGLLASTRRFYNEYKDAFAFEDKQREAERLIKSADPDAMVIITVTASEAMQKKLDRLHAQREISPMLFDSGFGTSERLQEEWDEFVSKLKPEERATWAELDEEGRIREFVKRRRGETASHLRWLTKF